MNQQSFDGIQWVQQRTLDDLKSSADAESFMVEEAADDQIAAENLIFMAQDGHVAEIINAVGTDENGTIIVAASDNHSVDCPTAVIQQITMAETDQVPQREEDTGGGYTEEYVETPQMVTEEVITDDWVQHQGEERVEIPAEQIIGSNSQVLLDMEVPLPTVQDEYTALRPYPCDFCSRRFRKKASLMNHMVAHQNDRPHLCKLCGSRFFRRSDLINHFRAHAEAPDPEYEVSEFMNAEDMNFVEQEAQQDHTANQYYQSEWNIDTNTRPVTTTKAAQRKQRSTNSTSPSTSPPSTTHGRAGRPRIKQENFVTNETKTLIQQRERAHSTEYSFMEGSEPLNSNEVLQDHQQQEQPRKHFPVLDESKPFVCQQCGLPFAREKALLAHVKIHRNDSPYECDQCNEMFWDSASLQDHQKTHQFEESNSEYEPDAEEADDAPSDSDNEPLYGDFYCNICGVSFHRQDLLSRHLKTHSRHELSPASGELESSKDRHCCNTCGETFAAALDLLAHAEIHARFPPFKCVLCGESFFEEQTIKRHLQCQHESEMTPNSCILCGKECRDRKALIKHAWDHSREKCHSCSKCGKNFHNKARLKRHMVSHRNKSVVCEVCNQEFPDGRSLSNHRHSHSTNSAGKLFPCHECGKTFGSRSSQQIHVRIHTGERPYGCRFCWKAFADGGTLRKHERIHTGEKPYACSVCPRAFNQRVVLREHIRSHHSGIDSKRGTYYCSVCCSDLPSSNDLMQHLIQHSDMNTAKQRQPIAGPRKYKRRRKLKPHELARLRSKNPQNGTNTDVDMSDFEVDNVDDYLGITETASASNAKKHDLPSADGLDRTAGIKEERGSETAYQASSNASATGNNSKAIGERTDAEHASQSKFNNTNEDSYKNLFTNLDNTLHSIDALVVDGKKAIAPGTAQRTQQVQIAKADTTGGAARGRRRAEKTHKNTRPKMIHTERSRPGELDSNKRRSRSYVTRTEATRLDLLSKNSNIADDYDIMSPDTQVPNQISSSPVRIKQEQDQMQNARNVSESNTRCNDLYNAQLLLEASTLRREDYEKFNPSIVNDLEEILRSPDKSQRQRFTSESSTTQFLAEQSEEEHNVIKIEPSSPDLRDLIPMESNSPMTRRSTRPSRNRSATFNRKYLEYETDITTSSMNSSSTKRNDWNASNKGRMPKMKKKDESSSLHSNPYIDYDVHSSSSSTAAAVNDSFSSISAVVSAANAIALAAAAPAERKKLYFECEMCSAVFPDRAQLLDHVPIHI